MLEITKISIQGIKTTPFLPFIRCFSPHHVKLFITITTFPSSPCNTADSLNECHVYTTRAAQGGPEPTWEDKFHVPVGPFGPTFSCLYLRVFALRALLGPTLVGWAQIPALDLPTGLSVVGLAHHLSYRLRKEDGSRGCGVINVTSRFVGGVDTCKTSIGVPVSMWPIVCTKDQGMMDKKNREQFE